VCLTDQDERRSQIGHEERLARGGYSSGFRSALGLANEYVFDHVRFTSRSLPEPRRPEHLHTLCEIVRAGRTVMFGSDYPQWDIDDPRYGLTALPATIRQRVKVGNAVETYGARP
jgi:predicted TIM-barrel fold metal-dependent hydrolase